MQYDDVITNPIRQMVALLY